MHTNLLFRCFLVLVFVIAMPMFAFASSSLHSEFFDFGESLTQEFRGTYEFKYKRLEFHQSGPFEYSIRSSGDQSPRADKLFLNEGYVHWVFGDSSERWLKIKIPVRRGDRWWHTLGNWRQRYVVTGTNLTVTVPAGQFKGCARVTISWIAHEHDMQGAQKVVLYLAPRLGIIKREYWAESSLEHEEVLTSYERVEG